LTTPAIPAVTLLDTLQRHEVLPDSRGWRVIPAPGGTSERTFSLLDPSGIPTLTVRLARLGLGSRLQQEEAVLRELASEARGWTPTRITRIEDAALPEGQLLVHEHLSGEPALLVTAGEAAREAFATCLAWVHQHPRTAYMIWPDTDLREGTRASCFHDRLATLRRYASAQADLPCVPDLLQHLDSAQLPGSAGWHESGFALLHGDLSLGNILWEGDHVALIDWEFARDGDPAEDLAYLIADQDIAPDIIAELADTYVGAGGDPWAFARLPVWLPLVALDAALWWADFWLQQGEPATHPTVLTRLERARRYVSS
jgi:aminoglycoside phosphotransferase (APT) family kinase protein